MGKADWWIIGVVCGIIAFAVLCACILQPATREAGYRSGQIDAANGVMKYEIVEQADGTTAWEQIDNN